MAIVKSDFGAVIVLITTDPKSGPPKKLIAVRDEQWGDSRWKLPGGSIEAFDRGVIAAAKREVENETGILLEQVTMLVPELPAGYRAYLCAAWISADKMGALAQQGEWVGDEDGHPLRVRVFDIEEILGSAELLDLHRSYIYEILTWCWLKRAG